MTGVQTDEQLGSAVVSALANLTQGNEDNARALCDARGVGPLLRVLLEPSGPGVQLTTRKAAAQALRALTQLLYTDEQRKAVQVGGHAGPERPNGASCWSAVR
jgi:hypothetical protein